MTLCWQEGRPTESGWFWLSNYESRVDPFIEYVHQDAHGMYLGDDAMEYRLDSYLVYWFAGPIPEPTSE